MIYTRREIAGILKAREGLEEGHGYEAFMDFRVRVTPEVLGMLMDSEIVMPSGQRATIYGINVDEKGFANFIMSDRREEADERAAVRGDE